MNLVDLSGRKILIVGASSGIGRAAAILLSRVGATVFLAARRETMLQETLALLNCGVGHKYYVMDVSESDSVCGVMRRIVLENGALDGMVYCAGIGGSRPMSMLTPEKLENCLNTNLYGFVECVRVCMEDGYAQPGMSIVGISSVAAVICDKGQTAYAASKAGMNGAMRSMAVEMAEKGMRINTVVPGMIDTGMYGAFLDKYDAHSNEQLLRRQYLGIGKPEDVANVIAWLLSSAARCITGVCVPIDGGYTSG